MRVTEFIEWLQDSGYAPTTVNARTANCRTLEQYCGNLDTHYITDQGASLLRSLEVIDGVPRHQVPIKGNAKNGTATLKGAATLYFKFSSGTGIHALGSKSTLPGKIATKNVGNKATWPTWDNPSDEETYHLAKVAAKYIKFLNPEIVKLLVEDNLKNHREWSDRLEQSNINAPNYLWEGSSCAFPGIRRYAGSLEIAYYRKRARLDSIPQALRLDDNDFPKHIWSFIFKGKKFAKKGPEQYQLAHLADHKDDNNRCFTELKHSQVNKSLYGLYTSASNAAYISSLLLKPTDHSVNLRLLLLRRAQHLYGEFCKILPPGFEIPAVTDNRWTIDNAEFHWADPVGTTENMDAFLKFRKEELEKLFI